MENMTEVAVSDDDSMDLNETETKQEQIEEDTQMQEKHIYIPELDEAYSALYTAVLSEDCNAMIDCAQNYLDTIRKYHGASDYFGVGFDGEHAFALYEDPYISETYYSEYDFKGMAVEFLQSYSVEDGFHLRIGISDYTSGKLNGETIYAVMYYSPGYVWNGATFIEGKTKFTGVDYVKVNYTDGSLEKGAEVKIYSTLIENDLEWASYTTDLVKSEHGNYVMAENPIVEASEWIETTGGKRVPSSVNESQVNDIALYSMSVFQAFMDCTAE